jgi:enamine deaminase RidA (YjgF/YER057c/UK114 family)
MPRQSIKSSVYKHPTPQFVHAVRVACQGSLLLLTGVTARQRDGSVAAEGDIDGQMRQVFENIRTLLTELGATLDDVVRIVAYVTGPEHFESYIRHKYEYFGAEGPVGTVVQVIRLFDPRLLVEIEATAVVTT